VSDVETNRYRRWFRGIDEAEAHPRGLKKPLEWDGTARIMFARDGIPAAPHSPMTDAPLPLVEAMADRDSGFGLAYRYRGRTAAAER
jgi:hypothetical protein